MKALIGVDVGGDSHIAIDLFKLLKFQNPSVTLLHAVESVLPDGSFPGMMGPGAMADIMRETEAAGKEALTEAASRLGGAAEQKLVFGDAYRSITDAADELGVDLIAVCSHRKSAVEAFVTGSVTRGLLTGSTQSFLAAKPGFSPDGPLKVVFATDQSAYSQSVVNTLLQLAPMGIGELVVATVLDDKTRRDLVQQARGTELEGSADVWAEDRLNHQNGEISSALSAVAPKRSHTVLSGKTNQALRALMQSEKADLLIIGAQGHGFFERLRSGSTSFHQVVAEDHSVLVLRPQT